MVVRVSSKGQIVLPASVRKRFGIETGDELVLVEWGNAIHLVPKIEDPIKALKGILKDSGYSLEQFKAERRAEEERRERDLMDLADE